MNAIKSTMGNLTAVVEQNKVSLNEAAAELQVAHDFCESEFELAADLNMQVSSLFTSFELIAATLLRSDLEEIGRCVSMFCIASTCSRQPNIFRW